MTYCFFEVCIPNIWWVFDGTLFVFACPDNVGLSVKVPRRFGRGAGVVLRRPDVERGRSNCPTITALAVSSSVIN